MRGPRLTIALALLTTFGPLSLDLYLPVLPALTADLGTTASAAQLTITSCLLGLSIGQVVAGAMSDVHGRRVPLLVGMVVYVLASIACAVAPNVATLVAVRFVQGFAGGAGIVIARAVARDVYGGPELLTVFARLMLISGVAPIVAPVLGAQLAHVTDWRGIFGVLAALGLALLVLGTVVVTESLPPDRRSAAGLRPTLASFAVLVRDRSYVAMATCTGMAGACLFAYISASSFVLQRMHHLSAAGFALAFAVNSLGIVVFAQVAARFGRTAGSPRILVAGVAALVLGAVVLAVTVLVSAPLPVMLVALFLVVAPVGVIFSAANAIALEAHPRRAGAAASLLGLCQFVAGAIASPLVGVAGESSAVPLAVVVGGAAAGAGAVAVAYVRRRGL